MNQQSSIVQEWVDIAKSAASGGNAQPWIVEYSENSDRIEVFLSIDSTYIPERSPLDVQGMASVFSLGALTINFINVAAKFHYRLVSEENSLSQDLWNAKIRLSFVRDTSVTARFSVEDLLNRCTNRYPFQQKNIPTNLIASLHSRVVSYSSLRLFEFDTNCKTKFIKSLVPLENIRWQNQIYLEKLLSEINFEKNIQLYPDKIPVSQLGINKADQIFFKLLKNFKTLQYLVRKVFFHLIVPKVLSGFSKNCDCIFVLQANSSSAKDAIEFGKAFQELWIMINKDKIAFQPLGTTLVALGYWLKEPLVEFTSYEKKVIEKVTEYFLKTYFIDLKKPTMIFRLGYPKKTHGRAPRKKIIPQLSGYD